MTKSLFSEPDSEITRDLAKKLGCDIIDAITRTLDIAPPENLPIVLGAGIATVQFLAKQLEERVGISKDDPPLNRTLLVAALLIAHTAIHRNFHIALEQAMKDAEMLANQGRLL